MIVKALVGAALLAVPASVAPAVPLLDQQIPKVVCPVYAGPVLLGWSMGSAFRIGPHLLLSVKHVTNYDACYIDGRKITVNYTSPDSDFSIISDSQDGPSLKIDCNGFRPGRKYLAVGHGRGLDQLTTVELTGTGVTIAGQAALKGIFTVVPGMSGGPVVDAETGRVVGTTNSYMMDKGLSGSVELKNTSVCKEAA
jgi:hypothetical protein